MELIIILLLGKQKDVEVLVIGSMKVDEKYAACYSLFNLSKKQTCSITLIKRLRRSCDMVRARKVFLQLLNGVILKVTKGL